MISYSGRVVIDNLSHLERLRNVTIFEVARSLGGVCRFARNTERPVSVLTHSFAVAFYIEKLLRSWGVLYHEEDIRLAVVHALLHEAGEAFIGDIPQPFKTPEQRAIEHKIRQELFAGWGIDPLPDNLEKILKNADNIIAIAEAEFYGLKNRHLSAGLCGEVTPLAKQSVEWAEKMCPFMYGLLDSRAWSAMTEGVFAGSTDILEIFNAH